MFGVEDVPEEQQDQSEKEMKIKELEEELKIK